MLVHGAPAFLPTRPNTVRTARAVAALAQSQASNQSGGSPLPHLRSIRPRRSFLRLAISLTTAFIAVPLRPPPPRFAPQAVPGDGRNVAAAWPVWRPGRRQRAVPRQRARDGDVRGGRDYVRTCASLLRNAAGGGGLKWSLLALPFACVPV